MRHAICSVFTTAALLAFAGCDQGGGSRTNLDPGKEVDTASLEKCFQEAEPTAKDRVKSGIDALKAGNYREALTELQGLLSNFKLTPEQKQSVQDAIAKVKDKVSRGAQDAIDRTKEGAGKAIDGVKKPFEK